MATIWQVPVIGIISTLSMDLLTGAATWLGLTRPLPPNLLGRWLASVARAQPIHADIARSSPVSHELLITVPAHYTIGIALTMLYVWGTGQVGWPRRLGVALGFGLCTNVLPWLLMFPAMGYGFFGAHGPEGTRLFVSSFISHACFGLGLWMAVRVIGLT
jgi:hypothetical protein